VSCTLQQSFVQMSCPLPLGLCGFKVDERLYTRICVRLRIILHLRERDPPSRRLPAYPETAAQPIHRWHELALDRPTRLPTLSTGSTLDRDLGHTIGAENVSGQWIPIVPQRLPRGISDTAYGICRILGAGFPSGCSC
jgi:hypothetical protein